MGPGWPIRHSTKPGCTVTKSLCLSSPVSSQQHAPTHQIGLPLTIIRKPFTFINLYVPFR
jgi:hypothetical protein